MENKWTTPKGAEIRLVTEHITSKVVDLDGDKFTTEDDRIEIKSFEVNGKQYIWNSLSNYKGDKVIKSEEKGAIAAIVIIPEDIYQAVWGEYDVRQDAKFEAASKADAEYRKNYNAVKNAMSY